MIGYPYDGFWAGVDTFKDRQHLEGLCAGGVARENVEERRSLDTQATQLLHAFVELRKNGETPFVLLCESDDIEIGSAAEVRSYA